MHQQRTVVVFIGARPNLPKFITLKNAFRNKALAERAQLKVVNLAQHDLGRLTGGSWLFDISFDYVKSERDGELLSLILARADNALARLEEDHPTLAIVLGDVNSTVAAALTASRLGMHVAHLEAGLRVQASHLDPEEVNRKVITAASDFHFAVDSISYTNLVNEGVDPDRIFIIGNSHIEPALCWHRLNPVNPENLAQDYILVSFHKPITLSDSQWMDTIFSQLASTGLRVILLAHHSFLARIGSRYGDTCEVRERLSLPDTWQLIRGARGVVTDSAGLQEEASVLGIPCAIVGAATARESVTKYTRTDFVGFDVDEAIRTALRAKSEGDITEIPFWDTDTSHRLSDALLKILDMTNERLKWKIR